jgi:hypothetical protein
MKTLYISLPARTATLFVEDDAVQIDVGCECPVSGDRIESVDIESGTYTAEGVRRRIPPGGFVLSSEYVAVGIMRPMQDMRRPNQYHGPLQPIRNGKPKEAQ